VENRDWQRMQSDALWRKCVVTHSIARFSLIWYRMKKNLHLKRKSRSSPAYQLVTDGRSGKIKSLWVPGDCSGFGFTVKIPFHAECHGVIITGLCCFHFVHLLAVMFFFYFGSSFVFGSFTSLVAWIQFEPAPFLLVKRLVFYSSLTHDSQIHHTVEWLLGPRPSFFRPSNPPWSSF